MTELEQAIAVVEKGREIIFPKLEVSTPRKKNPHDTQRAKNGHQKVDPITDKKDIRRIADYLWDKKEYRNYLLFVMGCYFGLRAGDLLNLQVKDFISDGGKIAIKEQKTGKMRYIQINTEVQTALNNYLHTIGTWNTETYIFESRKKIRYDKNIGKTIENTHIRVESFCNIMKKIQYELHLPYNLGTHSCRKTFAYHYFMDNQQSSEALAYVMQALNHSSITQTLKYIGLNEKRERAMLKNMDLGIEVKSLQ